MKTMQWGFLGALAEPCERSARQKSRIVMRAWRFAVHGEP
jgi:hypothetical protein